MKHFSFLFIGLLALGMATLAHGQSVIGSASQAAVINNQFHAWSVGEMCAVSTQTAGSLTVTQGFLQPGLGSVSTGDAADSFFSRLSIFPNPSAAILNIKGEHLDIQGVIRLGLRDARGALLREWDIPSTETGLLDQVIDLQTYPAGAYLLTIQNIEKSSTFIITKL